MIQEKMNYNSLVNLSTELKKTQGEDVVVAVLDTGCYKNHKDISKGILAGYDALTETEVIIDESDNGHGTFICGIIAGNTSSNGIIGIAPKTKIIPIRVIQSSTVSSDNVLKGLDWLIKKCPIQPDIINMSFDFSPGTDKSDIEILLQQANERRILIIAAGQDYDKPSISGMYYPAALPSVLSIATLDAGIVNNVDFNVVNEKIKFIVPQYTYYSTFNDNFIPYSEAKGSSFATAVLTGVFALAIAYKKRNKLDKQVTAIVNEQLPLFEKELFTNTFKIWRK